MTGGGGGVGGVYRGGDGESEEDDLRRRLGYRPDIDNVPDMAGVRTTIDNRKGQSKHGPGEKTKGNRCNSVLFK